MIGRNGERIKSVIERSGAQCSVQQGVDRGLWPRDRERRSHDAPGGAGDGPQPLESGLQSGTWDLEEACRAKARRDAGAAPS